MTRRSFLAWLGLAPVVGPQVVKAAASAPAPFTHMEGVVQIGGGFWPMPGMSLAEIAATRSPTGKIVDMDPADYFEHMRLVDADFEARRAATLARWERETSDGR